MNEPLFVNTDGVKSLSELHDQVAAAMSQLTGPGHDVEDLKNTYGTISSAFTSALDGALPSRDGTFRATQTSSQTIGELLQKAAQMYQQGDEQGAAKLRAAAEALAGSGSAGGAGSGGAGSPGGATGPGMPGGGAAGTGADGAGQMASQVGQQVGQIAQGLAQSIQGLAQGLTQLPQQVMQGVQGMVESASKSAESDAAKVDEKAPGDPEERKRAEDEATEKRAEEDRARHQGPATHTEGAQPGKVSEQGRAPEPPPVAERPKPAQTRPQ